MAFKIACFGVHDYEVPFFKKLNQYDYDLKLIPELLTHDNVGEIAGCDGVLLRGNCVADAQNLAKMHDYGITYVFTRTIGYDHIDLPTAASYGMKVARVPGYSAYSVAELALSLGLMLFRHTADATARTATGDYRVTPTFFSREAHSSTIGIIGTGHIGVTEAQLWRGMGATVLGYDVYQSDVAKAVVEFVDLPELAARADIISLHVPYFPGQNDKMINAALIGQMKSSAVLVNTARGELVDYDAVLAALQAGQLDGFASDVLLEESQIFGKKLPSNADLPLPVLQQLAALYPKVLFTPHMGSLTEPALEGMISVSYDNFHTALTTGTVPNEVVAK
ncbi:NAD(P)-dependent oxidoreductase [Schleiferilactobacillus shenzhenensis]|uniref:D-lactate dehydrogenase n=1 Tax=Schleiferilactobacillus shenzhenensis LY-73 TaxID=1231336 RepID=U4TPX2_9LACO|nr:NAD(P)-dependent oxidoreductase [Schleiferilactobacillus shenzhenensis]ERL63933.1 D-lactate dehydrogenase [Schleiferilactobacillus shenzhenensis LY-73]